MPSGRVALLAFAVTLIFSTPSRADCDHDGQKTAEGARVCQAGVVSVCSTGAWLQTLLTCPVQPNGPAQALMSPAPASPPVAVIHVLTASYRAGNSGTDFVYALRALCDGKPACTMTADSRLLGSDPAPRQPGQFSVIFACTTGFETVDTKHLTFAKGPPQTLSCGE